MTVSARLILLEPFACARSAAEHHCSLGFAQRFAERSGPRIVLVLCTSSIQCQILGYSRADFGRVGSFVLTRLDGRNIFNDITFPTSQHVCSDAKQVRVIDASHDHDRSRGCEVAYLSRTSATLMQMQQIIRLGSFRPNKSHCPFLAFGVDWQGSD